MASNLATAYVQILPSTDGLGSAIADELNISAGTAGEQAGKTASSGFGKGLATLGKVGAAAIGAATAATGAFAKSAVETGKLFDSSMSQVAATMGLTMEDMANEVGTVDLAWGTFSGNLREYAQEMGKNTAFSATEAADALNYMALAGYDAQTSMNMLPNVLNLAASGGMDLARASDMVTDTQTAFGISLERTSLMVDEMAKAASTGNTSVEQLGDAFLTVGGLAQELNGGFVQVRDGAAQFVDGTQELEIALTAMANAGVKGTEAGTHMRNMLLKLSSPTKDGAEQLEALGVSVFDTEGQMRSLSNIFGDLSESMGDLTQEDKINAISDLFNTRDLASAEALLNAVDQDWDAIGASILDAKVPFEDVKQAMQDAGVDITKFYSTMEEGNLSTDNIDQFAADIRMNLTTLGLTAEEAAENMAADWGISFDEALQAVNAVKPAIDEAAGSAQQMADTQLDNLAGDITYFQSALEGAKIAVSDGLTPTLREFVQFGTDGLSDLTAAFQEGGVYGAMSKLGDILAEGVGMLATMLPDIVNAGAELLGALATGILDNLPMIAKAAMEIITNLGQKLAENASDIGPSIALLLSQLADIFVQNLPAIIDIGMEIITGLVSGITESLPLIIAVIPQIVDAILSQGPELMVAALEIANALIQGLVDSIPVITAMIPQIIESLVTMMCGGDSITAIMEGAITLFTSILDALPEIITNIVSMIPDIITAIISALLEATPQLIEAGITLFVALIEAAPQIVNTIITLVPKIITSLVAAIVGSVPKLKEAGIQMFNGLAQAVPNIITKLGSEIPKIINGIVSRLKAGLSAIRAVGSDLLTGLWNGMNDKVHWILSKVTNIGNSIIEKVNKIFGRSSPSKVFRAIGNDLGLGLGLGWEDSMKDVNNKIGKDLNYKGNIDIGSNIDDSALTRLGDIASVANTGIASASVSNAPSLDGVRFSIKETIDLGDTKLKSIVSDYVIKQIGSDLKAVKVSRGGFNAL